MRWNNHQNHILRQFDALLQTKSLVDVTLVCSDLSIRAHKVVLSACSPFFQNVFAENPCKHPVIVLKDFPGWVVQAIVDFMYRGEISVPQERLQILIQAGESLQIRGLVDHPVAESIPLRAETPAADEYLERTSLRSPIDSAGFDETLAAVAASTLKRSTAHQHLFRPAPAFVDRDSRETNCTSPMPRRKQARPRRRSGECGPHDLPNKQSPPLPFGGSKSPLDASAKDVSDVALALDRLNKMECEEAMEKAKRIGVDGASGERKQCPPDDDDDDELGDEEEDDDDDIGHEMDDNDMERGGDDNDDAHEANMQMSDGQLEDTEDGEGPENLCIKNTINNNSESLCDNNKRTGGSVHGGAGTNFGGGAGNRIALSLKDIRLLNRPPSNCRQNPFPGSNAHIDYAVAAAAAAAQQHHFEQQQQRELRDQRDQRGRERDREREPAMQQPTQGSTSNAFLQHQSEHMKREALEARLESESPYLDHMDLSLAAAAAAAHHQHSAGSAHHPNARHHDIENSLHKDFTPSSPMSLPSHFNPREGPPHPPSPLQFPGISSALTLTPPHHSKYSTPSLSPSLADCFSDRLPAARFPHSVRKQTLSYERKTRESRTRLAQYSARLSARCVQMRESIPC